MAKKVNIFWRILGSEWTIVWIFVALFIINWIFFSETKDEQYYLERSEADYFLQGGWD